MKKNISTGLLIALMGISVISCNKEDVTTKEDIENNSNSTREFEEYVDDNDYGGLTVTDGVLEFSSIAYYESFFDDILNPADHFLVEHVDELEDHTSHKDANPELEFEDEFIPSIVNEDQIVKIGEWYIKVNEEEGSVFVASDATADAYESVKEEVEMEDVYAFRVEDEVLEYLKDEELLFGWKIGCSDRKAAKKTDLTSDTYVTSVGAKDIHMNIENKYVKGGIYFALRSEGTYTNPGLSYWSDFIFHFQLDNCSYEQRCGSSETNYSHPWKSPQSKRGSSGSYTLGVKYKWYTGTKQLKSYNYKVRLRCSNYYDPATGTYDVIYTNYAHIADS